MKAIFFDRDGTIIEDKHYLSTYKDVVFFNDTIQALKIIQELGYECFLVTNQSGLSRGYFTIDDLDKIHQTIQDELASHNLKPFLDIIYCPHQNHHQCDCRKPNTKMLLDLSQKHNILKENSIMVGNRKSDYYCGKNFEILSYMVYEQDTSIKDKNIFFPNLLALAEFLKNKF